MKKRIICLLAALLLLLGLSVSASAAVYANVIDTAELLSESEAEANDNFIKVSGADALRGDTRSHPEHDG